MIRSFGDAATEDLYHGNKTARTRRFPADVVKSAMRRKLDMIEAAVALDDLRCPPGNHLEAHKGDLAGYHSIRVNSPWRIVFKWVDGHAWEVRLTDYHQLAYHDVGVQSRSPLGGSMLPKNRIPTHPGEILLEEFLRPLEIPQTAFAEHLGVPVQRINELIKGKRGVQDEDHHPDQRSRPVAIRAVAHRVAGAAAAAAAVPAAGASAASIAAAVPAAAAAMAARCG